MSELYLTSGSPNMGDTIEFLKDLLPEDREEFLFGKRNEAEAINGFINALKYSRTYALRLPGGKILAMGGFVPADRPGAYRVWLLCAEGSGDYPAAVCKTVCKILKETDWSELRAEIYRKSVRHARFAEKGAGFVPAGRAHPEFALFKKYRSGAAGKENARV